MTSKKKKISKPISEDLPDNCNRCGQKCKHDEDSRLCDDCEWDDADFIDSTYDPD